MRPSLYPALFFLNFNFVHSSIASKTYQVPEPTFEVFSPRGFRVSIPHEDGVHLFAFHGNINKPMRDLEAGEFSKDILRKKGGKWVFEDHKTELVKGDVIYYWLFVIKNSLGYRLDDGRFVVKDITKLPDDQPINTNETEFNDKNETIPTHCTCEGQKELSDGLDILRRQIEVSREVTSILQDIVAKNDGTSKTLKFEGVLPPYDDPSYTAHVIISEKLGALVGVVKATWNNKNSITFQVANLEDKIYLIRKAKEKLANSKIKLTY